MSMRPSLRSSRRRICCRATMRCLTIQWSEPPTSSAARFGRMRVGTRTSPPADAAGDAVLQRLDAGAADRGLGQMEIRHLAEMGAYHPAINQLGRTCLKRCSRALAQRLVKPKLLTTLRDYSARLFMADASGRNHGRNDRPAAKHRYRHCLGRRAGSGTGDGDDRRLADLGPRRKPRADRRADRSLHRCGLWRYRAVRLRRPAAGNADGRHHPDDRRPGPRRQHHRADPGGSDRRLHDRHRADHRHQPTEGSAGPRRSPGFRPTCVDAVPALVGRARYGEPCGCGDRHRLDRRDRAAQAAGRIDPGASSLASAAVALFVAARGNNPFALRRACPSGLPYPSLPQRQPGADRRAPALGAGHRLPSRASNPCCRQSSPIA